MAFHNFHFISAMFGVLRVVLFDYFTVYE